ncbi:PREDICTED: neuronal acetylcholine receptor subunit alpha-7-like [Acropora digitifera]|uniref:neuronal acetylcholine receptor subunit alpha-7-like n=1 Tax=Acropora digitifera TaxID=70779 RepID=UPI00077A8486|nr:PREDICTED: neuronal acetylcholine receptor subunit alpha-7-like [Acropora digitifera]
MLKTTEKLLFYLLFHVNLIVGTKQYYEDLERLQTDLFLNYSTNIIPQKVKATPVEVKFDIALNQIIDLDERLQTVTTIVWVRLFWNDFRLEWNSSNYGEITSFVTSSKNLWLPDVTLYNNANDNYNKEKEEYYGLTINSTGDVGWFYPTIFKSSCTIDVTYFPFDDQKCVLKFGSWSYNALSLNISHNGPGDTEAFTDNGEWVLVGMPVRRFVTKYRCCPELYPFITYDIIIRRRTIYYILNFLTPCVLVFPILKSICQWCANALRVKRNGNESDSCVVTKRCFKNHSIRSHFLGEHLYDGETAEATNPFLNANNHKNSADLPNSESAVSVQLKRLDDRNPNLRKRGGRQSEALDILVKRRKKDDEKERHQEEWRFAAKVLNRLFMWIVVLLVVFNCLSVLFSAPVKNLQFVVQNMLTFVSRIRILIIMVTLFNISNLNSSEGVPNSQIVKTLENHLMSKYDKDVIPKQTLENGVPVTLDLALNQIIDVNKRAQTITAVIWVRQYWKDHRLQWNSSEYDDINTIVIPASFLWLPDITLYNNARDDYDIDKEAYHSLTIKSDGNISRFFPTIYKASCNLDVTNFPFDDQICSLKLGSWAYNIFEMDLYSAGDGDISSFIANGEWLLHSMPSKRHVASFRCCPHPYVFLTYDIHIRRRALYYVLNCFMPCLIMMALTILSFYLPSETGERMGVGITVLLSLSIIQLILSDSLPPTSEVPLIVAYYGLTMLNIFLSLVFSCIVLIFFHHSPDPMPQWMRVYLCEWGAKVLRMQQSWNKIKEKRKHIDKKENPESSDTATRCTVVNWIPEMSLPSAQSTLLRDSDNKPSENEDCDLTKKLIEEDKEVILREEWKFASRVLNKFFMWIIVIAIMSNAVFVILRAPSANFM